MRVDVTDGDAVAAAAAELGPVDILVNSAGIVGPNKPLCETTRGLATHVFEVNVLGHRPT